VRAMGHAWLRSTTLHHWWRINVATDRYHRAASAWCCVVCRSIAEVSQMFQDLAALVQHQSEMLDR